VKLGGYVGAERPVALAALDERLKCREDVVVAGVRFRGRETRV
jgi:hypothetical protein